MTLIDRFVWFRTERTNSHGRFRTERKLEIINFTIFFIFKEVSFNFETKNETSMTKIDNFNDQKLAIFCQNFKKPIFIITSVIENLEILLNLLNNFKF